MGYLSIVSTSFPSKWYHCSLLAVWWWTAHSLTRQTRSLNLRRNSNSNATRSVQTMVKMLSTTPWNFQYGKCCVFRVQTNSVLVQNFTRTNRDKLMCGYLTPIPHYAFNKYNNIIYLQKWQTKVVSKNVWRQIL